MHTSITVRFYGAAAEAAGTRQGTLTLDDEGTALQDVLSLLPQAFPPAPESSTPPLARVCSYSSFLINAVQADPHKAVLTSGDTLDVLPPFAGG